MAVLLMKLRHVPEDELAEIEALLQEHELEYFSTSAGLLGISLPALWLVDKEQLDRARALLDHYAAQRQAQARALYASLCEAGKQRTMADMARERPLRFLFSLLAVVALLYVSFVPFF